MRERFRNWMRTPSLRGQLIWLSVSSVLVTLLISLLILVLLISNVMGPFVNREAEFAMQTVSRSLSTKTQLLEDILLRICKSPQMTGEASDARGEQFRSLVDIYSDKNIVAPGLPFVEMAYFMDMRGSFDVVSYHEQLSSEQLRLNEDNLARYRAFQESGTDVQCTASEPYLYIIFTVYDRWADPFGTVIFVVNQSAVTSIMGKLSDYQDAFWYLFDKDGAVILSESALHLNTEEQRELADTGHDACYTRKLGGSRYLLFSEASGMGLRCAVGVPSVQILRLLYQVAAPYVIACVLLLLAVAAVMFFAVMRRLRPLQEMTLQLRQVAQQNFSVKLPQYDCQEFSTMSQAFNAMTDTIDHLINDVYEKKLVTQESELRFLQSQINPHFMYNVLCSIALMAQMDGNADIQKMASNFAGLTQARLSGGGDVKIPLAQELQYAKFYIELQQMRFGEKISYQVSVSDEELLTCLVPKLIIEMLVENAVGHGIEPKDGSGTVHVSAGYAENGAIELVVADDGVGFEGQNGEIPLPLDLPVSGNRHNRVALNTVYKIMQHLYGPAYGIHIISYEQIGTTVTIHLPREEITYDQSPDCR
jgi:two-component system sensor histidine kinase YesM